MVLCAFYKCANQINLFAYLKECDEEYNKASEFIQEERKRKQMEAIVAGFKYKSNLQKGLPVESFVEREKEVAEEPPD